MEFLNHDHAAAISYEKTRESVMLRVIFEKKKKNNATGSLTLSSYLAWNYHSFFFLGFRMSFPSSNTAKKMKTIPTFFLLQLHLFVL
jgi:hypothetical protein